MPSKDVKCKKKTLGFQHFILRMNFKKMSTVAGRRVSRFPWFSLKKVKWYVFPRSPSCAWLGFWPGVRKRELGNHDGHTDWWNQLANQQVKTCERNGRDGGWGRGAQLLMILRVCKRYRGSGKEQVVFQFVTKRLFTANHPNTHHVPVQDPRFWFVLSPKSRSRRPKAGA